MLNILRVELYNSVKSVALIDVISEYDELLLRALRAYTGVYKLLIIFTYDLRIRKPSDGKLVVRVHSIYICFANKIILNVRERERERCMKCEEGERRRPLY